MAHEQLLKSWRCVPKFLTSSVRYKRYRAQNEKQAIPSDILEKDRQSGLSSLSSLISKSAGTSVTKEDLEAARRYKFVHPEFLPSSQLALRDLVCERLEREDMMKRRAKLDIPEFYVGSYVAVTLSDPYAEGFTSRFVGICIQRDGTGLRHNFTLRNAIDGQGIEIMYELYNPTIRKIEVLKLEKRLDEELLYLRDAPLEFSQVPFDLEPTPHPKGSPVPINSLKIRLNPRPWHERWERFNLKGVEGIEEMVRPGQMEIAKSRPVAKPWEKHDLVKRYRDSVPTEDQDRVNLAFAKEQKNLEQRKAAELDKLLVNEPK